MSRPNFTHIMNFDTNSFMQYFPILLDLRGKKCLVVGSGQVGRRKITRLIDTGAAQIHVVDPFLSSDLEKEIGSSSAVKLSNRPFRPEDLEDKFLVIASTADPDLNAQISRLCQELNILCNIVDHPELCSFILPALMTRGGLILAVSTSGKSPALASKIKNELAQIYGPDYSLWIELLGLIRPRILEMNMEGERNKALFHSLTDESILKGIEDKNRQGLLSVLQSKLPRQLHTAIEGIVDELFSSF